MIDFEIPLLPKTTNAQTSMHWSAKQKYVKSWHDLVGYATVGKRPRTPLIRAKLTLTRFSSSEPDFDGLVSSFKHVIDALIVCGVLANDKVSNIGQSIYLWEKAPRKNGKIRVTVESIE